MSKNVETPPPGHMDAEGARGDLAYGTDALDDLLNLLAGQISDADRQHGETMRGMQARVEKLGDHTESVKASLPHQHAPAFERIENGMSELADRFSEGNRAQRAALTQLAASKGAPAAPAAPSTYYLPEADSFEFVPAITSKPALIKRTPAVFEERWDRQDAEALTRHYETAEAEPPRRLAQPSAPPSARSAFATAPPRTDTPAARPPIQSSPPPPQMDASWLDQRLSEIAARVEQSLAALRPESALLAINQRFDQFESRVTRTLDDVAARADVGGLGEVEKQLQVMSRQVEQVFGQLDRLEHLEAQVGTLRDKLSDEHIVKLFENLVPTQEDLSRFAEEAAVSTAQRFIASGALESEAGEAGTRVAAAHNSADFASLHALLAASAEEGKRSDTVTVEMLDTIQLALQQVLDRIESLETAARAEPPQHEPFISTSMAGDGSLDESALNLSQASSTQLPSEAEAIDRIVPSSTTNASVVHGSPVDTSYEPPAAVPSAPLDVRETAAPTIGPDGLINPPARRPAPATLDRRQMIEMARQAAENARAQVAAQNAERTNPSLKSRLFGGGTAEPQAQGGVRPGLLLIASIAAFLLAASFFILGPKLWPGSSSIERPAPTVAPVEPDAPPAKTPAINGTAPAPANKQQGMAPSRAGPVAVEIAEQPSARSTPERPLLIEPAAPVAESATTASAASQVPGIALDDSARAVSAADLMRARQRAHLAQLSHQTAQNAIRPPVAADAVVPPLATASARSAPAIETASVPARPSAPRTEATPTIELPPMQVGPNSLRIAAANGDASAQFEVAARLAEAKGVAQNFAQAAVWYQRAATQGLAQAQYRLASLYERGLGVPIDQSRAGTWYARAAEQGNLKAMHNLAVLTAGSDNGTPDYATAANWFSRAAEHGLTDSQFNLGVLHENGLGVGKDPITAYKWYALAAAGGDVEAARRRDQLKPKLDPASLAVALRTVAEWKPRVPNAMANDPRVAGEAWKARAQAAQ